MNRITAKVNTSKEHSEISTKILNDFHASDLIGYFSIEKASPFSGLEIINDSSSSFINI